MRKRQRKGRCNELKIASCRSCGLCGILLDIDRGSLHLLPCLPYSLFSHAIHTRGFDISTMLCTSYGEGQSRTGVSSNESQAAKSSSSIFWGGVTLGGETLCPRLLLLAAVTVGVPSDPPISLPQNVIEWFIAPTSTCVGALRQLGHDLIETRLETCRPKPTCMPTQFISDA